jgi:hypothetical protein
VGGTHVGASVFENIRRGRRKCEVTPTTIKWYTPSSSGWVLDDLSATVPAVKNSAENSFERFKKGKRHSSLGPAVQSPDGNEYWLEGEKYPEDIWEKRVRGSKIVSEEIGNDGIKANQFVDAGGKSTWVIEGTRTIHRDGKPAIESGQNKYFVKNGRYHNYDGPAILSPGGIVPERFYMNGVELSRNGWLEATKNNIEPRSNNGVISWFLKGTEILHNPLRHATVVGGRSKHYLCGFEFTKEEFESIIEQNLIIEVKDGGKGLWFRHPKTGRIHRKGGPAIYVNNIHGNYRQWIDNGNPHRADGAAIYYLDQNGEVIGGRNRFFYKSHEYTTFKALDDFIAGEERAKELAKQQQEFAAAAKKLAEDSSSVKPFWRSLRETAPYTSWGKKQDTPKIEVTPVDTRPKIKVEVIEPEEEPPVQDIDPPIEEEEMGMGGTIGVLMAGTLLAGVLAKSNKTKNQTKKEKKEVEAAVVVANSK